MSELKEALAQAIDAGAPAPESEPIDSAPEYTDEYSEELDGVGENPSSDSEPVKSSHPNRDEKGRFLPKGAQVGAETTLTEEVAQDNGTEDVQDESPKEPVKVSPPSGFGKHRDLWAKLTDPQAPFTNEDKQEVLAFYKQRETEMLKGLGEANDVAKKSHYLSKSIEHLLPDLQREGIDPGVMFGNLAQAHLTLKNGSPQEKIQTFQYLAQQYGIQFDPNGGQMAPMDSATIQMMEKLRGVESKLSLFEQERLQNESRSLQSHIEALESDVTNFPLFNEAREAMASLLEQGLAQGIEEAYRKAIRLDDGLWEKDQARRLAQTKPRTAPNVAHLQRAKEASASVRSQAPVGEVTSINPRASRATNDRNSIRDALTKAFG